MKKSLLYLLVFAFFSTAFSQEKSNTFPTNVLGIYKGDLTITNAKGTQKIPMEFHFKKTDSIHKFDYVLVYNKSPRNYTLVVKDLEKGIFEVDENNGIVLPSKFANNTLFSFFEVQGNLLSSRIEFINDTLIFEILFTAVKNKVKTGGLSKEIPEVFGYPISVVQKAILKKVKN